MSKLTLEKWLATDDKACADIVRKKYLISEDILGHEETIDEFLDRVSLGDQNIRSLIEQRRFIPGGRILAGLGLDKYGIKASYSNCYVLKPPKDSIKSIYGVTCSDEGETFSRGGGCGIDISNLAPRNAKVNNTAKKSSGAASFMNAFNQVAEQIGQNGRRGALLLSMKDTHPDLEEFIKCKRDLNKVNMANISVMVSDEFMKAVNNDEDWKLYFDRKETGEHIEKIVKARYIMRLIAETNWEMGEPGMLFWDTFGKYNLMSEDPTFEYAGTNPCGEEPLPAGGACLLGSMNLSEYYDSTNDMFMTMQFAKDVRYAIRYLDTVLDLGMELHAIDYQREVAKNYRQIGLGVMGLADLFIKKKIKYGSGESLSLTDIIGYTMAFEAVKASCELAKEKGAFPLCNNDYILKSSFIDYNVTYNRLYSNDKRDRLLNDIQTCGLRNSALLTCAPTGTTSTIFNVSNGIEPLFALEYERTTKTVYDEETTYKVHPASVQCWLNNIGYSSMSDLVVENIPDYFVTARDIHWKDRIQVQATLQRHIDASISSTINLPESTTVEDIEDLYKYAYKRGCKGITVFRENCDRTPILKDTTKEEKDNEMVTLECEIQAANRENKNNRMYTIKEFKPLKEAKSVDVNFTAHIYDKIEQLAFDNLKNCSEYQATNGKTIVSDDGMVNCSTCIKYKCTSCIKLEKEIASLMTDVHIPPMYKVYAEKSNEIPKKQKMLTRADFGEVLPSTTYYMKTACGHVYIIISRYNGMPVEVFMNPSKSGGCAANNNALGRMASTMLRSGMPVEDIIDSIIGIRCDACSKLKGKGEDISGLSCSDIMARVLKREYDYCLAHKEDTENKEINIINAPYDFDITNAPNISYDYKEHTKQENIDNGICPDCGKKLLHSGGCINCTCGFSLCS